ncbi:MAG: serpin family protein, partial [Bacteroidales bacterium]|nr:serpin family protein [Bacteroidales bacterium]
MKQEKLHDALNFLDEDMIAEVDKLRSRRKWIEKHWKKWVAAVAAACIALVAVGIRDMSAVQAKDLMEGIEPQEVAMVENLSESSAQVTDFGIRLFQSTMKEGESTLLSPLSVLCALSMTANGAEGETLRQMEEVLGLPREELNSYMYTYMSRLPQGEKYKLSMANSIWFADKNTFRVNQEFLQTNADYYGADIYKCNFDNSTVGEINQWVKQKTDNMIPAILDEMDEEAVMVLINALAFEAQWQSVYNEHQVREREFTLEDGTIQNTELMYSEEYFYLEDAQATGFMKYYVDEKYAFVALLPNEGVSVAEYVNSLTGEHVQELLQNTQGTKVEAAIPKFETEYNVELREVLSEMGMQEAFDMM